MVSDNEGELEALHQRRLACENSLFQILWDDVPQKNVEIIRNYLVVAPKTITGDLVTGVAVLPIVDGKLGLLHI